MLNDYHKQRNKRVLKTMSKQPPVSLEDAMKQYGELTGERSGNTETSRPRKRDAKAKG